ncbi:hypothetical protein C7I87_31585 [Mesorhizobium sp. SARCC-RB16n]|nr:hypothetical protein C7I87_31585 [Mesorhizobium sp. SARCC-RB16n]
MGGTDIEHRVADATNVRPSLVHVPDVLRIGGIGQEPITRAVLFSGHFDRGMAELLLRGALSMSAEEA